MVHFSHKYVWVGDAFTFNLTAWNGAGIQFTAAGQLSYHYIMDQNGVESTNIPGSISNNLAPDIQIALAGHVYLTATDFIFKVSTGYTPHLSDPNWG